MRRRVKDMPPEARRIRQQLQTAKHKLWRAIRGLGELQRTGALDDDIRESVLEHLDDLDGPMRELRAELTGERESTVVRDKVAISPEAAEWLASGERGLSNEALFSLTVGLDIRGWRSLSGRRWWDHPHDPDDFQRCERMLRMVPEARGNLDAARVTPEWSVLIEHWDELVALIENEVPGVFEGPRKHGSAPRSYRRMCDLLERRAGAQPRAIPGGTRP